MKQHFVILLLVCGILARDFSSNGKPKMFQVTTAKYFDNPSSDQKTFYSENYYAGLVYVPYFDSRSSFFPYGFIYLDTYAIYTPDFNGNPNFDKEKQWILKDANGNYLYIPFACNGNACSQYAADISSPGWRQYYLDNVNTHLAGGNYMGVFCDDVNLQGLMASNGNGDLVAPIDPNTGRAMTYNDWCKYFADFMSFIRANVDSKYKIIHNSIWYAPGPDNKRDLSQYILQQNNAADYINREFGLIDGGLTGGNGDFSVNAMFAYFDRLHSRGKNFIMESTGQNNDDDSLYNLAGYLLVTNGQDFYTDPRFNPDYSPKFFIQDLGSIKGDRYSWNNILRRDFDNAIVLFNEPGASSVTVQLGGTYNDPYGNAVSSVTVNGRSGTILYSQNPVPPSPTPPTPSPNSPPSPTPSPSAPTPSSLVSNNHGVLQEGEKITDPSGIYYFTMQQDGNGVIYGPDGPVWATGSFDNNEGGHGYFFAAQDDGNLVIYKQNPSFLPVWASSTYSQGTKPYVLKIESTGDIVWTDSTGAVIFSSPPVGLGAAVNLNNITGSHQFNNVSNPVNPFDVSSGFSLSVVGALFAIVLCFLF